MGRTSIVVALSLLAGCVVHERTVVRPEPPPVVVAVSTFDVHLSPYGAWLVVPGYGRVWQPGLHVVGADFYPYATGGTWVYTDVGWVFDSTYPFGWAVFHYGRWVLVSGYGWLWVPGDTWGPAWVSWRTGGTWVGWAPLGPAGPPAFHHHHWCFVPTSHFTVTHAHRHRVPDDRFHEAVAVTQPVPARGAHGFGPPPAYVTSGTRHQVVPVPLANLPRSGRTVPPPPPPPTGSAVAPGTPPPPGSGTVAPPPPPPTGREPGQQPPPTSAVPPPPTMGTGATPPPPTSAVPPPPTMGTGGTPPPPTTVVPPPPSGPSGAPPPPPPSRSGTMGAPPPPTSAPPPGRVEPMRVPAPVAPPPGRTIGPSPVGPLPPPVGAPAPAPSTGKKKTPPSPPSPGPKTLRPPPPPPGR